MINEAEYLRLKTDAISQIREKAPHELHERLIRSMRPAISIRATPKDEAGISIGASKFGGSPDTPPNFEWPTEFGKPLGFLGQINLEEVIPFDMENLLPQTGILAFFHRFIEEKSIYNDTGQVIWFDNAGLQRIKPIEATLSPDCMTIPPCQLAFEPEWTTLEFHGSELKGIWDYYDYMDVFRPAFGRTQNVHRMLGYPIVGQDPPFITAECERTGLDYSDHHVEIDAETDKWRLLLQLDSQRPDWLLGDVGTMFFVIRKEDLAAGHFEKTQFYFEGC